MNAPASLSISVQEELKDRNQDLPCKRKVEFRIGISLGDGVNIAARLGNMVAAEDEAAATRRLNENCSIQGYLVHHSLSGRRRSRAPPPEFASDGSTRIASATRSAHQGSLLCNATCSRD